MKAEEYLKEKIGDKINDPESMAIIKVSNLIRWTKDFAKQDAIEFVVHMLAFFNYDEMEKDYNKHKQDETRRTT